MKLTHLHAIDLAWLLALLEGGTMFAMGLWVTLGLSFITGILNNILLGAFVGFIGTCIALFLWRWRVRGRLDGRPLTITKIKIVPAAIANAVFLITLFSVQDVLPTNAPAYLGFLSVAIAGVILLFIYNAIPFKLQIRSDHGSRVLKVSPIRVALIAGMYEAIILPLMAFLQYWINFPPILTFTIAGFFAGLIGGFIGTLLFNILAPVVKPGIELA